MCRVIDFQGCLGLQAPSGPPVFILISTPSSLDVSSHERDPGIFCEETIMGCHDASTRAFSKKCD